MAGTSTPSLTLSRLCQRVAGVLAYYPRPSTSPARQSRCQRPGHHRARPDHYRTRHRPGRQRRPRQPGSPNQHRQQRRRRQTADAECAPHGGGRTRLRSRAGRSRPGQPGACSRRLTARPTCSTSPPSSRKGGSLRTRISRSAVPSRAPICGQVIGVTYHEVWWPSTETVRYEGEQLPVWHEADRPGTQVAHGPPDSSLPARDW